MPKKLDANRIGKVQGAIQLGHSISEISRTFKMSRQTIASIKKNQLRRTDMDAQRRRQKRKRNAKKAAMNERRRTVARIATQKVKFLECPKKNDYRVLPKYPTCNAMRSWFKEHRPDQTVPSISTIYRDTKACGLKNFRRPKNAFRDHNKPVRRRFCRQANFHIKQFVKRMLFTDEHTVNNNDHSSLTCYSWSRAEVPPRNHQSARNAVRLQFWAGISYNYKTPIVWIDFNDDTSDKQHTLNQYRYRDNILSVVKKDMQEKKMVLMQDGARPHHGKEVMKWLEKNKIEYIRDWPSNSPDLNPVEQIWKEINSELSKRGVPHTVDELKKMVEEIWAEYPMQKINNHVMSFMGKCKRCLKNNGGSAAH